MQIVSVFQYVSIWDFLEWVYNYICWLIYLSTYDTYHVELLLLFLYNYLFVSFYIFFKQSLLFIFQFGENVMYFSYQPDQPESFSG